MSMRVTALQWGSVLLITLLLKLGPCFTVYLVLAAATCCLGFLSNLVAFGKDKLLETGGRLPFESCPASHGLPKLVQSMKDIEGECAAARIAAVSDKRLTGAGQIDEALSDVVSCIMRDFMASWYGRLSDEQTFPQQAKSTLEKVLVSLAQRLREVEWIQYCTQTLTNDFGSHIRLYKRTQKKMGDKAQSELEKVFFEMELQMEGSICRSEICTNKEAEKDYLRQLSEVILILMAPEESKDILFRHVMREIFANYVLLPLIDQLSDPDYFNQNMIWLCKANSYTFEFLTLALQTSTNEEELKYMREPIEAELTRLQGRDIGGEDDAIIKSQLNDLRYLRNICKTGLNPSGKRNVLSDLNGAAEDDDPSELPELPSCASFDAILENNAVLNSFHKYLASLKAVQFLDIYHRLTGYRTSMEKFIYHSYLNRLPSDGSRPPDLSALREVAHTVFEECARELQEANFGAVFALERQTDLQEALRRADQALRSTDPPTKDVFENLRRAVGDVLRDPRVLVAFKKSEEYRRLLLDLGYIAPDPQGSDADVLLEEEDLMKMKPGDPLSDEGDNLSIGSADSVSACSIGSKGSASSSNLAQLAMQQQMQQQLTNSVMMAEVYKSERLRDSEERAFAVYVIKVTRLTDTGPEHWEVYRRYSDFDDLHALITEKHARIPDLKLPPKRTFNNMKLEVVQQRQRELDCYLKVLLSANNLERFPEVKPLVCHFLEPGVWEKKKGIMLRQVSSVRSNLRSALANVKQSADGIMDFLTPSVLDRRAEREALAQQRSQQDAGKMTLGLDVEDPEEVPLRILLLLVEEVFDGRRASDFRRVLYQVLKRIVRAVFGNKLNAYIVETAQSWASSEAIADYIRRFREGLWPNGVLAESKPPRDIATKMRTRVICRAKMLGSVASELTQYLGTGSTRHGVCRLFELFQRDTLNRRFVHVLLEGWLQLLFPENNLQQLFERVNKPSSPTQENSA